jgi:two-component system chemotaxis response regulator CheY
MITDKDVLTRLKDKSILVVDDEKFSRSIVARLVQPFAVVEAGDGGFALHQLAATPGIGVVLCDFNMPLMDGLTFLKEVRRGASKVPHDLPVLMLTGHSDASLVQAALALDVDGFIVKPVSKATLEARLKHLLTKRNPIKEPGYYEGVNLTLVHYKLLSPAEAKTETVEPPPCPGRRVKLEEAKPKEVLAADVCAPSGEVLLGEGIALSDRLIARLKELSAMGIAPGEICVV